MCSYLERVEQHAARRGLALAGLQLVGRPRKWQQCRTHEQRAALGLREAASARGGRLERQGVSDLHTLDGAGKRPTASELPDAAPAAPGSGRSAGGIARAVAASSPRSGGGRDSMPGSGGSAGNGCSCAPVMHASTLVRDGQGVSGWRGGNGGSRWTQSEAWPKVGRLERTPAASRPAARRPAPRTCPSPGRTKCPAQCRERAGRRLAVEGRGVRGWEQRRHMPCLLRVPSGTVNTRSHSPSA